MQVKNTMKSPVKLNNDRRGGAGRGQGLKPIKEGEASVTTTVRLAVSQHKKLQALGSGAWIRARIDEAPDPKISEKS